MSITTYAELQTAVGNWLNRTDLDDRIPEFIALAESRLNRDNRVRDQVATADFSIATETEALPDDYGELISLYHDGGTYYGAIETVDLAQLAMRRGDNGGATGVPRYMAVIAGSAQFAPEPDTTYTCKLSYKRKLTALSDSNTSNWLLASHPDIYLYATLVEAIPYLKEDERVGTFEPALQARLNEMRESVLAASFSGSMRRRPVRPIG